MMRKSLIIKICAISLCLVFFMPFFLVSCSGMSISINGPVMAFGSSKYGIDGYPVMMLLFVLPACVVGIFLLKKYNKYPEITKFEDVAAIASSAVSLLLTLYYYSQLSESAKKSYVQYECRAGFYLTLMIDIAVIAVIIYYSVTQGYPIIPILPNKNNAVSNFDEASNYCRICGNKLEDDKSCMKCGTPIPNDTFSDTSMSSKRKIEFPKLVLPKIKLPEIKWTKQRKAAAIGVPCFIVGVIGLNIIGAQVTSKERTVSEFCSALASKDINKITKYISSSDPRIEINESAIKPLVDYIDQNPSWVKSEMDSLEAQSKALDSKSVAVQGGSSGDIILKYNGKKFFFFNSYSFELKPYFININTNLKDTKILVNEKEVCTSDSETFSKQIGPYLPGVYNIEGVYEGKYAKLDNKQQIIIMDGYSNNSTSVHSVDLPFDARYVSVRCDFEDAKLYVNGEDTGVSIKDAGDFGPVDSSVKLKAVKDFPWGTVTSGEVQVNDSWSVNIPMTPSDESFKDMIMNTVAKFRKSRVEALINRDSAPITDATSLLIESEKKHIEYMISNDRYFRGKLNKIIFDLDSMKFKNDDGKYYLTISTSECYDSVEYYKIDEGVRTSAQNIINEIHLIYDESSKKWLVDSVNEIYSIGTKNLKEKTFN